jgi:L-asparaginase
MKKKPEIAILSLGGTIAMTESAEGGLRPVPADTHPVLAAPLVSGIADVSTYLLASAPSASLTLSHVREVALAAMECAANGASGVVVTQGTDTLEETAYLLDLWWPRSVPMVVTGAMRGADQPSADGPGNVINAVRIASESFAARHGVLVTLADEIHAARYVRKVHSTSVAAFKSPGNGAIGFVSEGTVRLGPPLPAHDAIPIPIAGAWPQVAIVESVLGDNGTMVDAVMNARFDGVIVSATGVGHVSEDVAARIEQAALRVPCVLTSRTGSGRVATKTYSFVGSERDLIARGAIPSGLLDARKSRLLLTVLLANGSSRSVITKEFEARGAL